MVNNEITDFGVKIGGAKKDFYTKNGGLDYEDAINLHTLEKSKFIIKDNIWLKPNYKKMLEEDGYDAYTLYFIKNLRDALPAKPTSYSDIDVRKYIELINIYKDVASEIKVFSDIPNTLGLLKIKSEKRGFLYLNSRNYKKAYNVANISKREIFELQCEVQIQNFPYEFNGKLKGLTVEARGFTHFTIVKNGKPLYRINYKHDSLESAMKAIKEEAIPYLLEKETERSKSAYKKYTRPQLAHINRIGPDYRNGMNITGEMILSKFNLRGGEFGNWNTNGDKQACLNYYFEAVCDLMEVLKAPLSFAGLGFCTEDAKDTTEDAKDTTKDARDTRLAIAFGARGQSSAAAHYEPASIVINLTKMNGAGSLAHEVGHAIDHFVGESCGYKHSLFSKAGFRRIFYKKDEVKLYPELQDSFNNLIEVIKHRECTNEEMLEMKKSQLESCIGIAKSWLRGIEKTSIRNRKEGVRELSIEEKQLIIDAKEMIINEMTKESVENLNKVYKSLTKRLPSKEVRDHLFTTTSRYEHLLESIRKIEEDGFVEYRNKKDTNYYAKAKEMDKLVGSHYLQGNEELFARAFESYVEDQLKNKGRTSDYLVHSTFNSSYENYNPYPAGEERILINKEMEKFLKILVSTFSVYLDTEIKEADLVNKPIDMISTEGEELNLIINEFELTKTDTFLAEDINSEINSEQEKTTPGNIDTSIDNIDTSINQYTKEIEVDTSINKIELSDDEKEIEKIFELVLESLRI